MIIQLLLTFALLVFIIGCKPKEPSTQNQNSDTPDVTRQQTDDSGNTNSSPTDPDAKKLYALVNAYLDAIKANDPAPLAQMVIESEREPLKELLADKKMPFLRPRKYQVLDSNVDGDTAKVAASVTFVEGTYGDVEIDPNTGEPVDKPGQGIEMVTTAVFIFNAHREKQDWKLESRKVETAKKQGDWLDDAEIETPQVIPSEPVPDEIARQLLGRLALQVDGEGETFLSANVTLTDLPNLAQNRRGYMYKPEFSFIEPYWEVIAHRPGLGEGSVRYAAFGPYGVYRLEKDQDALIEKCKRNGFRIEPNGDYMCVIAPPEKAPVGGEPWESERMIGAFRDGLYYQVDEREPTTSMELLKEVDTGQTKTVADDPGLLKLFLLADGPTVTNEYLSPDRWKYSAAPKWAVYWHHDAGKFQSNLTMALLFNEPDDALDVSEELGPPATYRFKSFRAEVKENVLVWPRGTFWSRDVRMFRERITEQEMNLIVDALLEFKNQKGRFPTEAETPQPALTMDVHWKMSGNGVDSISIAHMAGKMPTDMWGSAYRYRVISADKAELKSAGPDGIWDNKDDLVRQIMPDNVRIDSDPAE